MLQSFNIDRADSVSVSKAPFTYESTMMLGGSVIPAGSFVALKVYVDETYKVPFRLHSIDTDGRVWFCDANGAKAAYWKTYEGTYEITSADRPFISSLLYNQYGVIAGFISCTHTVLSLIRNIVESNIETVFLPDNAFVLIPQCHTAMIKGCCKAIGIGSQDDETVYTTSDINITGSTNAVQVERVVLREQTDESIRISLSNSEDTLHKLAPDNGICVAIVGGGTYCCADSSIIIKSKALSNLRAVKQDNSIILRGVLNA